MLKFRPPEDVAQGLSWKTKSLDFDNCMTVNFCLWNVLFMSNKPPKKCCLSSVKNDQLKTPKNDRETEFGITLNYSLGLSTSNYSDVFAFNTYIAGLIWLRDIVKLFLFECS